MNTQHRTSNTHLLYSIQALRGVGAVAVVIFHALSIHPFFNFRAGAAGVDLFFIISGIVMALSIRPNSDPRIFFLRRLARVVPLYWLMTGLAVLNVYIFYPGAGVSIESIIRSLLFLRPENGSMPILYPGWSLNYEMLFYLALSVFLYFGKYSLPAIFYIFLLLGSLSAIDFFNNLYYIKYYLLEFSAGLLIGHLLKHPIQIDRKIGILAIICSLLLFFFHNYFQSNGFIAWGIPSLLLVIGCYAFDDASFFKNQFIQSIGDASYSIYLIHPFIIWAFERNASESKGFVILALAIVLSIALGILCYRWIEKPLLNITLRAISKKIK